MSTLGSGPRSSRAPPIPSSTHRPIDGSTALHKSVAGITGRSFVQCRPPSTDVDISCMPGPGRPAANWNANTYATPWLSVRIVQPERPKPLVLLALFVEGLIWFVVHLSPPSVEVATTSGC